MNISSIFVRCYHKILALFSALQPGSTIPYRRTRIGTVGTREDIEQLDLIYIQKIAGEMGYEERENGEWVQTGGLLRPVVSWELAAESATESDGIDDAQWVLIENIALPISVIWALFGGCLLSLVWIYLPFTYLSWIVVVVSCLAFASAFLFIRSPADSYIDRLSLNSAGDTVLSPNDYKTSCTGPAITATLTGFVSSGPLFLAGLPLLYEAIVNSPHVTLSIVNNWAAVLIAGSVWMGGFWAVGLFSGLLIYLYEDSDVRIRIFPFDALTRLSLPIPELTGGYITLLAAAIIPIVSLTFSSFLLPVYNHLNTIIIRLYFLTPPMFINVSLLLFFYWWTVRNRTYVYERTIKRLAQQQSRREKLRTATIIIVLSYLLVVLFCMYILKFQSFLVWPLLNGNPVPLYRSPLVVFILLLAALPALYFILGTMYQFVSFCSTVWGVFVNSRPIGSTPRISATLRIIDDQTPRAFAFGAGPVSTVVVSSGLISLYRKDSHQDIQSIPPLDALIAHEEAHLDSTANEYWLSDASVSILATGIGCLTFSGKNIIYGLLDFREREQQADLYAATATDPSHLITALNRLGEETGTHGVPSSIPFVPSFTPVHFLPATRPRSLGEGLERYFGLLFGSFALARAHPDISERIDTLSDHS